MSPHTAFGAGGRPIHRGASPVARLLVGVVLRLLRLAPRPWRERFAWLIGWLAWTVRIRRTLAVDSIQRAFPERTSLEHRRIARLAYDSMSRAMLESVTSDLLSDEEIAQMVSVVDWKGLDELLAARKPVLIASAHFGSWELFAEVMARRGHAFSAVVRPLSGAFNEWLVRGRKRAGMQLILQEGALRGMLRALRQGQAVVQLIDQALPGPEAVWVPFFGRPASTTPALSMAALRTGAPVYFVVAIREAGALHMQVEGPIPMPERPTRRESLEAHAAQLTEILEAHVRRHPEQWLWLHRRWKQAPALAESSAARKRSGGATGRAT